MRADVNPSYTPTWSLGETWHVQANSLAYSEPKIDTLGTVVEDFGIGPVFYFSVVAADSVEYIVAVDSCIDPNESYELHVSTSDFVLTQIDRRVIDAYSDEIVIEEVNPALPPDFVLFASLETIIPLDFPNMPATNTPEIRTITLDDSDQEVTQTVSFGADMVVLLSTANNDGTLTTTSTWATGQKWWVSAERYQDATLVSSGTLLVGPIPDQDSDGLDDGTETFIGTELTLADTDGDGLSDYEEQCEQRSDPLDPNDPVATAVEEELLEDLRLILPPVAPNPSNLSIRVSFGLPRRAQASIRVYDVSGRLVRTLLDGLADGGSSFLMWDLRDNAGAAVPSGVYFVRLSSEGSTLARKVVLTR